MNEIDDFCREYGISASITNDSYYFVVNGVNYRVSNHSVESSNRKAFDGLTGEQIRPLYHADGRNDVIYIHAGKTRIVEIYNDILKGYKLDGRGNRIST